MKIMTIVGAVLIFWLSFMPSLLLSPLFLSCASLARCRSGRLFVHWATESQDARVQRRLGVYFGLRFVV